MIGLFDSGSGGLTVLSALRRRAPYADVVYYGDIKNAPYGNKSVEELEELARTGIHTLRAMGATQIIAACNSVSPAVLEMAAGMVPVIEMSRPTAEFMSTYHEGEGFLLMATPATIASGLYQRALEHIVTLDPLPVPDLAGAIEFDADPEEIRDIVREAFRSRRDMQYDGILLGCTHYPLALDIIRSEAVRFGNPAIVDPAEAVAEQATRDFTTEGNGTLSFRISGDSRLFRTRIQELFGSASIEVIDG